MVCNTAVFYDIENLIGLFSSHNNTTLQLDEIYRRILETEGVNGVSIQKAYTDWGVPINRNLRNHVLQIGIEPVQIFNTNQNDKVKNAADVSLIIDAVELMQKRPDIENYVIVSGDGIFAFLAKKLHEYGKRVIGVGFVRNTNVIFRNACDYFISLEKTDKYFTATSNKSALKPQPSSNNSEAAAQSQPAAPVVPAAAPLAVPASSNGSAAAVQTVPAASDPKNQPASSKQEAVKTPTRRQGKIPVAFPKTKFTETLINADFPVWYKPDNEPNLNGGLLAIRNMINTLFDAMDSGDTDLEISVFKTYVDYYVPGFKLSQYKFKRFGEFMSFIITGSPYCLFMQDGTILRIARRGAVGGKGEEKEDTRGLVITLSDGQKLKSIFDVPDGSVFTYSLAAPDKPKAGKQQNAAAKQNNLKSVAAAGTVQSASPVAGTAAASSAGTEAAGSVETETTSVTENNAEAPVIDSAAAMDSVQSIEGVPSMDGVTAADAVEENADSAEDVAVQNDSADSLDEISADAPVSEDESAGGEDKSANDSTSVRKLIKAGFMKLSLGNKLPSAECRKLTTSEYSSKTFGVKTPIFKEITTRTNLQEQRLVNGKVRYWKEVFKFNNKTYLVFKEWSAVVHRDRFNEWMKKHQD